MSGKKLTVNTVVSGEPGSGVSYLALNVGDTVPAWATDQVGDHCFAPQDGAEPDATDQADETPDDETAVKSPRSRRAKSESD